MRKIDETAFIADGAKVLEHVVLEKNSSVWFNAVLRGDKGQIVIGEGSNVQDNCVAHAGADCPVILGKGVTVGHMTLLHGCKVGDNTLVGMGSVIMNYVEIGKNCIVGAGSLITLGTKVPDGSLIYGHPAKVRRALTPEEIAHIRTDADYYMEAAARYKEGGSKLSADADIHEKV